MADIKQIVRLADTALPLQGGVRAPLSIDQLDYLVDLVSELREMSDRSGLSTLAAILALAQTEANAQIAAARAGNDRV